MDSRGGKRLKVTLSFPEGGPATTLRCTNGLSRPSCCQFRNCSLFAADPHRAGRSPGNHDGIARGKLLFMPRRSRGLIVFKNRRNRLDVALLQRVGDLHGVVCVSPSLVNT